MGLFPVLTRMQREPDAFQEGHMANRFEIRLDIQLSRTIEQLERLKALSESK